MRQTTSLAALAAAYADQGDDASLRQLRRTVLDSPSYDPGLDLLGEARALAARDDHSGILTLVRSRMPGAFFSPSAHGLMAAAFSALGDERRADGEQRTARLAMASIIRTGDGTAQRPWSVLRISDEYDVLRRRRRTSQRQTKVTHDGKHLDRHQLDDGSEAWFDVSLFFGGAADFLGNPR